MTSPALAAWHPLVIAILARRGVVQVHQSTLLWRSQATTSIDFDHQPSCSTLQVLNCYEKNLLPHYKENTVVGLSATAHCSIEILAKVRHYRQRSIKLTYATAELLHIRTKREYYRRFVDLRLSWAPQSVWICCLISKAVTSISLKSAI